jgi:hypothetical protein
VAAGQTIGAQSSGSAVQTPPPASDDYRSQFSDFLKDSYVGFSGGSINYPFNAGQILPGFKATGIDVPHLAVRVTLFGHEFNKYISGELGYMRPFKFVNLRDIAGPGADRSLWFAMGDITVKGKVPVGPKFSIYGETGLAIVNRAAAEINPTVVAVAAEAFGSARFGAGFDYHVDPSWDVTAGASYVPAHPEHNQSAISFASLGVRYTMREVPQERVQEIHDTGYFFPHNIVELGFTANTAGYGANNALAGTVFYGGLIQVSRGGTLRYLRNVYHTKRTFSLDFGASVGYWKTAANRDGFVTASVYPVLRFTAIRTKPADFYLMYSLAGPTLISERFLDSTDTGSRFTFQDMLAIGMFAGRSRHVMIEVGINHFSNGNMFAKNPGVKIPLTLGLGYTF